MCCSAFVRGLFVAVCLSFGFAPASAQTNYPNRTITMVVPLPAGGTADLLARIAAEQIRNVLGQPVVVENRPGDFPPQIGRAHV